MSALLDWSECVYLCIYVSIFATICGSPIFSCLFSLFSSPILLLSFIRCGELLFFSPPSVMLHLSPLFFLSLPHERADRKSAAHKSLLIPPSLFLPPSLLLSHFGSLGFRGTQSWLVAVFTTQKLAVQPSVRATLRYCTVKKKKYRVCVCVHACYMFRCDSSLWKWQFSSDLRRNETVL